MNTKLFRYVVGFGFTINGKEVLLIKKNKPEWQKGCFNGIGGKIEKEETPLKAMNRETYEETGLFNLPWKRIGEAYGINNDGSQFILYIFKCFSEKIRLYKQMEEEKLFLVDSRTGYLDPPHISNLEFIIPYCLCSDHSKYLEIQY